MKKKAWLWLLILVFLVSACNGGGTANEPETPTGAGNDKTADTAEGPAENAEPLGKYDPPVQLNVARDLDPALKFRDGENIDANVWAQEVEQTLGLNLVYKWTVPSDQLDEKMNVTIASGDLPDVFKVTASQLKRLVEAGQIEDLTSVYEQYAAPLTKQIMEADGGMAIASATFDGKLYAIPQTQSSTDGAPLLWVRTDWLQKLSLPEPTTMDDFKIIAEAFTNGDPDGNGAKDTYALAIGKDLWGGFPGLEGFFNAYHAYHDIWLEADGKLAYGSIQPAAKTALAELQQMFAAGMIDPEFAVKDGGKVAESMNRIGMYFGQQWTPIWPLQGFKEQDPGMEWKAYPIPSSDGKPALAQMNFPVQNYFVVRKGLEQPEAVVKLANLFLEKMWGESGDYGVYGTTADGFEPFKYALVDAWPTLKNIEAQGRVAQALESGDTASLNAEEKGYYDRITAYRNGDIKNWAWDRVFGPEGSQHVLGTMNENSQLKPTAFYGAATPSMATKKSSLDKLIQEAFTKIIMNAAPVDSFDSVVENWMKLGGTDITDEVNAWKSQQ